MRLFRLLTLGLVSAYPLYWTAQFLLFFVPESLLGFWLGQPVQVVSVSYLQAMAMVQPHPVFPAHWEALIFAVLFSALILALRADQFLTAALAIVFFGEAALLPFLSLALNSSTASLSTICAATLAFGLIILGLNRILRRVGGLDFLDRLALLSLLAVLPQAMLWLVFKLVYPFFDVHNLLLRMVPLYLATIVVAAIFSKFSVPAFSNAPWAEIVAISAAAGLLILAIGMSSRGSNVSKATARIGTVRIGRGRPGNLRSQSANLAASLAGEATGMLT